MSFNDYLQRRFEGVEGTEELKDVAEHGFLGLHFYELRNIYTTYEDEILNMCEECGANFPELAIDCVNMDELAMTAVWMAVQNWAAKEYENRMTTLEELSDDNRVTLQEYLDSPDGKENFELVSC